MDMDDFKMKNSVAVKELRDLTGMGFGMCQAAWKDSEGNMKKALELLKQQGATRADKLSERTVTASYFGVYRHHDGMSLAVVQLKSETDFVSKMNEFKVLADNIAMQYCSSDMSTKEELLKEDSLFSSGTIEENIMNLSAKTGEKIELGNIIRFR